MRCLAINHRALTLSQLEARSFTDGCLQNYSLDCLWFVVLTGLTQLCWACIFGIRRLEMLGRKKGYRCCYSEVVPLWSLPHSAFPPHNFPLFGITTSFVFPVSTDLRLQIALSPFSTLRPLLSVPDTVFFTALKCSFLLFPCQQHGSVVQCNTVNGTVTTILVAISSYDPIMLV